MDATEETDDTEETGGFADLGLRDELLSEQIAEASRRLDRPRPALERGRPRQQL